MEALRQLSAEGNHDFHFVTLVIGTPPIGCIRAQERTVEYNIYGTPVAWFDGGYQVDMGDKGDVPTFKKYYADAIGTCEKRTVEDVDIDLSVQWHGNAVMKIDVAVTNNQKVKYGGHLRVYITETQSSLGWNDSMGIPYDFAMLEYAFSEPMDIAALSTWEGSTTWDGKLHDNGWGTSYGSIQHDNITVIAAVFNDEWHQGYSDPPTNLYPFDAYYVDDTAAATPEVSLLADKYTLPEKGGVVDFKLFAGKDHAKRKYILLGSVSGTDPGIPLPGGHVTLPLNWDFFLNLVISLINTPVFYNFMGDLDIYGASKAQMSLGPIPGAAGITMHFAYALNSPWNFVSNPVGIVIIP